ncbi:hypothetical protein COU88_02660 [Candidatus Roizmanbacteria bacterium CG10_big_fil_rev_8_21_14_0_10_39_6]|uniref:Uncharacterized protein n=1 Tax=Candidatus Roizmanbacteria bacterium CG10_big_fil_rev_8_21_14_0_10_39_6 TaxID=1974853 RepID=A0A2M8KSH9_9BACT|nr:MAG: hypothetical protein COU88_02660 [Candidatus Roizmanbacteria bacterium CG10_big_fil_rev_8_21_14_0_10_39_6]
MKEHLRTILAASAMLACLANGTVHLARAQETFPTLPLGGYTLVPLGSCADFMAMPGDEITLGFSGSDVHAIELHSGTCADNTTRHAPETTDVDPLIVSPHDQGSGSTLTFFSPFGGPASMFVIGEQGQVGNATLTMESKDRIRVLGNDQAVVQTDKAQDVTVGTIVNNGEVTAAGPATIMLYKDGQPISTNSTDITLKAGENRFFSGTIPPNTELPITATLTFDPIPSVNTPWDAPEEKINVTVGKDIYTHRLFLPFAISSNTPDLDGLFLDGAVVFAGFRTLVLNEAIRFSTESADDALSGAMGSDNVTYLATGPFNCDTDLLPVEPDICLENPTVEQVLDQITASVAKWYFEWRKTHPNEDERPQFLFMGADHGRPRDGGIYITTNEIAVTLDDINGAIRRACPDCDIAITSGVCHGGKGIPEVSDPNTVLLTATGETVAYVDDYTLPDGRKVPADTFMIGLVNALVQGKTLGEWFTQFLDSDLLIRHPYQIPQADANGNGVANEQADLASDLLQLRIQR